MHKPQSKPVTASAVATITVEVHALGSWGAVRQSIINELAPQTEEEQCKT